MRIVLAYLFVVLLWTTTPLAIKWSGEGPGFLFAVTSRMSIGVIGLFLVLIILRQSLAWHKKALLTYFAVALQVYGSMMAIYWSAQFIPSGWISVICGLTPLTTALLAAVMLQERHLTVSKASSYLLGVAGLYIMFGSALHLGGNADLGIIAVLIATLIQSFSAVWIKRIDAKLPALNQVAGGLALALPCYVLTWKLLDGQWPEQLPAKSLYSIAYLGLIATTVGFILYYYLLTQLSATQVALISLTTPVMALLLGHLINKESLNRQTITGTVFILAALLLHELFDRARLRKFIVFDNGRIAIK